MKKSMQQYNYMQIVMYIFLEILCSLYTVFLGKLLSAKDVLMSIAILIVTFQSLNEKIKKETNLTKH